MNKYPPYLLNQPKPLVFITGTVDNESDIHAKIVKVFDAATKDSENKEQPSISFRPVANDYAFPEKKQSSKDQLSIEGILKYNWPSKHFESVPSVVIFTVGISVDWGPTEWQRKEFMIQEKFNRLKNILGSRDIKLIVIAIKSGTGTIDKDVIDDRITSFKKHLQLNSNIFAFVAPAELLPDNAYIKKVAKTVKESSIQFYTSRIKSLKSIQKSISEKYRGAFESILHARYCFKIAFYYEFQGNTAHSLKYYRQCYQALSLSIETIDEEMFEQVKTVAEMAHFKICNMLLFSTSVLEAFQQFKSHMTRFSKLYSEFPWKHYAWVSDQYVVFTQLLEMYAVNDSLPDADRAYYYHNAARYSQKRQISFDKTRKDMDLQKSSGTSENEKAAKASAAAVPGGRETFKGMILMPPRFIGSPAQILDPVLDQLKPSTEESNKLYAEYLLEQEYKVSHSAVIMRLLTLALERANPNFKRRKGFILSLIAEQCIKEDQFAIALQHLVQSAELLTSEGWVAPAVAVLGLIMKCATLLGRPVEYLNAALTLYANASQLFFSRYELEELHLNVLTLLESTLLSVPTATAVRPATLPRDCFQYKKLKVRHAATFLSNPSFISVLQKSEYGSCATVDRAVEFSLGEGHSTIDMGNIKKMFTIDVKFDNAVVELGQKVLVQLSLTSKWMDDLSFDEMKIYFTDNAIVKRVVNNGTSTTGSPTNSGERTRRPSQIDVNKPFEENFLLKRMESSEDIMNQHMSSNSDVIHTSLLFPSNKTVVFEFYIYISESGFASFLSADAILCLERVELMLSNEVEAGVTRQVIFDVAALPESVTKARKNVLKPMILKDILKYTFNDAFPTVTIQKPSALVSMFKPVVPAGGMSLLQGAVHRINVYFKVGACDMLDGCVFLSSDFNPTCEDDALFWYPDRTQLAELLQAHSNPSDELLDTVRFHALALNEAYQPAVPLSLGPVCTMDSVLFVPIFVKSNYVQSVNLKLKLEYVPRGRLKSSLSKEFSITVNFLKALDMSFRVAPSGEAPHDPTPGTVFVGDENLLTATLHCSESLTHAVGVSNLTLDLNPMEAPELQTVLVGEVGVKQQQLLRCNLLDSLISKIADGSKFPVHLRTGETFSECRYLRCGDRHKFIDTTQLPPQSLGGVTVHWRQMRRHVLRHTLKNNLIATAGPVTINNVEWLLPLSHRAAVLAEKKTSIEALNRNTTISAVGATYFSIPETKLLFPPFIVNVDAPSIATFGQILEVKVAIHSQQGTSERLKFATALSENFLLVGSTYCAFEVPSLGVHSISLTIVPLKCGFLSLPTMLLTWERSPTVTIKVLDTAAGSGLQQQSHSVFIHPSEVRQ